MVEGESKIFDQGEPLLEPDEQNEFNALRRKQLTEDFPTKNESATDSSRQKRPRREKNAITPNL